MELLEFLLMPEAVIGCVVGQLAARVIHWFAPQPEPVLLEAAVVVLGFVGGVLVSWIADREDDQEPRRD